MTELARFLGQYTLTGLVFPAEYATGGRVVRAAPYTLVDAGHRQFYLLPAGVGALDPDLHAALVAAAESLSRGSAPTAMSSAATTTEEE